MSQKYKTLKKIEKYKRSLSLEKLFDSVYNRIKSGHIKTDSSIKFINSVKKFYDKEKIITQKQRYFITKLLYYADLRFKKEGKPISKSIQKIDVLCNENNPPKTILRKKSSINNT